MSYIFQTVRVELDAAIKRNAHLLRGKILDVGAGEYDRYSAYFKASDYVRMNTTPGLGTQLVGRVEDIPAAENSFDGIVCTQVLGDVYDVHKAIREFHRVLKAGGRILLTEGFMDPLHDEPNDFWRFTPHSLKRLFEEGGFTLVSLEKIGGYKSVRAQLQTRYVIEKYKLYSAWYGRLMSFYFKILGRKALWRDARDSNPANTLFAHGWLVVAEKK